MHSEKELQSYIMTLCKRYSVLCYKFESPARRGVPDLLLLHNGRCCFIEVKSPSGRGRLTWLQERTRARIERYGVDVYVISDPEIADEIVALFAAGQ